MTPSRTRYKTNIRSLHALCETNYLRLLRLFPDYETSNLRDFTVAGTRINITVTERSRFTTFFTLVQHQRDVWLGSLRIELRCYHDVRMLEVVRFQSHQPVSARYHYPNNAMYQPDEKHQQNLFLSDWLNWCLAHGQNHTIAVSTST
ncbi:MAG: histidine kinase [Gammaproteobacteria bacterium]|nr:MAG: histidine kinase [Gammaproteobacteria bacterium]